MNDKTSQYEPYDFAKIRLFVDADLEANGTLGLSKDHVHYLANVMRRKPGGSVLLFNGRDGEWGADIATLDRKQGQLVLRVQTRQQDEVPDVDLLFAPVKKMRLDFLVQKATELGVARLRPVFTVRTIVSRIKEDRLRANVIEAAEQCGRMTVPEVLPTLRLDPLLDGWPDGRTLIFCDEAREAKPLQQALEQLGPRPMSLLIGPEGGFDGAERARLLAHPDCIPVSLGPRIMRADTAALAALAIWQSVAGDLR